VPDSRIVDVTATRNGRQSRRRVSGGRTIMKKSLADIRPERRERPPDAVRWMPKTNNLRRGKERGEFCMLRDPWGTAQNKTHGVPARRRQRSKRWTTSPASRTRLAGLQYRSQGGIICLVGKRPRARPRRAWGLGMNRPPNAGGRNTTL